MESQYILHTNPDIYPEPFKFDPQRWIGSAGLSKERLYVFNKGARMCIGLKFVLIFIGPEVQI